MVKSEVFRNPELHMQIYFSSQAQIWLGPAKVLKVVEALERFMAILGAEKAYVGKTGEAVSINIQRPDGWRGSMTGKKRG